MNFLDDLFSNLLASLIEFVCKVGLSVFLLVYFLDEIKYYLSHFIHNVLSIVY